MGNHQSSDKDTVLQNLWKAQRAIPVLPLNPTLDALRVLTKHINGYHDVGNVMSLSKPGQHQVLSPREQKNSLTTVTMGSQSYTIADNHGAVATKLTDTPAWFKNATSITVRIPECWVREYNMENWDDMVHHFNPDMQKVNSKLKNPDRRSERELFIVQKVMLVSHITITATYNLSAGPDVRSPVMLPSGFQVKPRDLGRDTVEFTISNMQKNQKLPIAFSGFKYTYDKFGELKSERRTQADTAGASSSHAEDDEDDEDEDEDEEDEDETEDDEEDVAPADDANMGDFLGDGDWCAQIISDYDPSENEIFDRCDEGDGPPPPGPPPPGPPPPGPAVTPAGSPSGSPRSPRDLEDID